MRPNNRRPSIAAGFGKVKLLRSRFERKDAGAQRAEFKWWTKHRNQSSFSVHTFPAQPTDSPDMSDCESMFDHIFSFNRKELPGQSACATQAISKFYGSRPTDRTVDGKIEPSEIQPSNKGYLYPKSYSPTRLDHDLESFNEQELCALGDIFSDQPSVYAEVWTNDAHFALELSHEFEDLGTDLAAVYGVIATLTGFLPTLNELEPRVQEVEDSHPECDSALTPRASDKNCPGYFVPVSESDATSILADDGSCLSYDEKSHYEPLINRTPTPSLRGYVSSTSSEIDHTEHPAFRTTSEEDNIGIETNDGSCISHGSEVHHEDLLDESSSPKVRSYAPSISAEVDHTEHPAFLHTGDQEGGNTRRTSSPVACELPALFASDEEGESSEVPSPPTGPSSAIPDSPTLGGHVNRGTWYACSLSPSEEEFFSDEAPTLAPLRFTSLPTEYEGYLSNGISRSSWPQAHRHTKPYLQFSSPGKGNRSLLPSQHEVPDDGANFLHNGLAEELDDTLYDDSDEFSSEGLEDKREVKDDDTMDNEAGDYVFSDAFLSSPFYPPNNERSPRKSIEFEPLPEDIKKLRATRANQDSAEALDDDDTAIHDKIATSASKGNSQVSADCFETLRAYRQKAVPKVSDSSRANSPDTLLAHGSPYGARPTTRPTTPTDREVNRYLQKTARPLVQTTSRSRCKTNQSFEIDYAVNTTPSLDPEISLERINTFGSTLDMQPRSTPSYKKLAQKASLSVVTSLQELSPPKSPSTTNTPKTTPTKKKFRFTGSWGRKGNLPAELRNNSCEVRGSELMCSPSPPSPRNALNYASYASPPSQRSPAYMSPVTQFQYQSSPQRTAPSTPLDELPPIPPRNPRRLDVGVWNASFPEMQQESIHFFNQLDPNLQKFYDEQKLHELREFTNTRVVYHNTGDPRTDYMKHPNHNRVWESHNLRCRVHEGNCAVCYAACCIHQSAEQTVKDIVNLPEEKRNARKLLSEINMYFKAGEEPTFVVCSSCEKKTAIMRTYEDTFSGEKIYPGKGKLYVRGDSKIFRFQNGKTESLFLQRKNPRRIAWTTLYRRQHKKGITEEQAKKRTRRTVKQQRGIVGASLDVIKERRSQRPEAREAARKEAIAKGKEKKATSESKKKAEKAKSAAAGARGQPGRIQSKMGSKGVPNKASGKTR